MGFQHVSTFIDMNYLLNYNVTLIQTFDTETGCKKTIKVFYQNYIT